MKQIFDKQKLMKIESENILLIKKMKRTFSIKKMKGGQTK